MTHYELFSGQLRRIKKGIQMIKRVLALVCILLLLPAWAICESIAENVQVGDPPLPGLLMLPEKEAERCPAVVLLHGSGPNDRDETVGNTRLFRDLAEALVEKSIASIRFDKRTLVYGASYTAEQLRAFTIREESMEDAVAAAKILRQDPRIDPDRIFLIGHSLGAMIAPRIAAENPGLFAGIILLSGSPRTLGEIVLHQNQAVVDALPMTTRWLGQAQMKSLIETWETVVSGTKEEALNSTVFGQPAYYFWEMAQYDTAEALKMLQIPVLIINGGADFQVTDADGYETWRALDLPSNVHLVHEPGLNHLLMAPEADESVRGTVQEYEIPCHAAQEVIEAIVRFILN